MTLELMLIDIAYALKVSTRFHFQKIDPEIANTIIFMFLFKNDSFVFLSLIEFMSDDREH